MASRSSVLVFGRLSSVKNGKDIGTAHSVRPLTTRCKPDLALIWRLLKGTGCHLAEITGLRVEDVDVSGEFPNVKVTWHEQRRMKTAASRRHFPLVGDALAAAKETLKTTRNGNFMCPDYCHPSGATNASSALMSHVKAIRTSRKQVVHSLRHNMKDRLMVAEVSFLDQNLTPASP